MAVSHVLRLTQQSTILNCLWVVSKHLFLVIMAFQLASTSC
uniref:Uncharacterized protein n=1 Tax=Rhizophora mucronata TaxID=61149 RepID=A0A2P2QSF6_RHIMU